MQAVQPVWPSGRSRAPTFASGQVPVQVELVREGLRHASCALSASREYVLSSAGPPSEHGCSSLLAGWVPPPIAVSARTRGGPQSLPSCSIGSRAAGATPLGVQGGPHRRQRRHLGLGSACADRRLMLVRCPISQSAASLGRQQLPGELAVLQVGWLLVLAVAPCACQLPYPVRCGLRLCHTAPAGCQRALAHHHRGLAQGCTCASACLPDAPGAAPSASAQQFCRQVTSEQDVCPAALPRWYPPSAGACVAWPISAQPGGSISKSGMKHTQPCTGCAGVLPAPTVQDTLDQLALAQQVAFQNWYGSVSQNQAFAAAPAAAPASDPPAAGSAAAESGPIVVSGAQPQWACCSSSGQPEPSERPCGWRSCQCS